MTQVSKNKPKFKRTRYTLQKRNQIIEDAESLTASELSKKYKIPPSSIRTIKKAKDRIRVLVQEGISPKLKRIPQPRLEALDKKVKVLMDLSLEQQVPVSQELLLVSFVCRLKRTPF